MPTLKRHLAKPTAEATLRDLLPMGNSLTTTQLVLLTAFMETCNISDACRIVGVGRRTHYDWQRKDEEYAAALRLIEPYVTEKLAEALHQRGFVGMRRYRFTKNGDPVMWTNPETGEYEHYYEVQYSDSLLLRLLEARDPSKYSAKHAQQHSGEVGLKRIVLEDEAGDGT